MLFDNGISFHCIVYRSDRKSNDHCVGDEYTYLLFYPTINSCMTKYTV